MAQPQIQPEIYAVIVAALLGALIGQFLSFYRSKRQKLDELKNILHIISQLEEEEIPVKIDREDSFLWYLRDELFQSYKQNALYLGEARGMILELIRKFPSQGMDQPSGYTEPAELKQASEEAFRRLDDIRPAQTLYLAVLGFLGLSQDRYGDRLDEFMEGPNAENFDELNVSQEDSLLTTGYLIPNSSILKIMIAGLASILLIVATAVSLIYFVALDEMVEYALMTGTMAVTFVVFFLMTLITMLGEPIQFSDEGGES